MKRLNIPLELIILSLIAFWLRAYRLETQSYWIEEGWTLYFAKLPVSDLWRSLVTEEIKPPFYYFTALYWTKLLGDGEYALRFLSLLFGVLTVPLTYRLGRALGDKRLGLLTALLIAVAPYQIWHSQEARLYSIFTAAATMSMWAFVEMFQCLAIKPNRFLKPVRSDPLWCWWLLYVIGTEWAFQTHYHTVVIIGVQGLFLLLTWRRYWRHYWVWGSALLAVLVLFIPWLLFASALLQRYLNWIPQPTLWETYLRSLQTYTVGEYMPRTEAVPIMLFFVGLYLIGLILAARRPWGAWRGLEMLAFLLAFTLAPNLAAWLYGELRTPTYLERYLIPVQVGFLLTIATGLLGIYDLRFTIYDWRLAIRNREQKTEIQKTTLLPAALLPATLAVLLLATLLSLNGYALWQHYFNPAYAKDDWRAVIRKIEAFEMPGDAIIITGDGGEKLFDYYYRGHLPLYRHFLSPIPTPEQAALILTNLAAQHHRLWFSPYGVNLDPTLETWLAQNAYPAWHSWLGRKRLALYAGTGAVTDRLEQLNTPLANSPENGLTLVSLALPAQPTPAGDLLPLLLTWQTTAPLNRDYQLSLRLINRQGDIFTQSDWPPLAAAGPTSTWLPGQPLTDRRSLWLPPNIPPGDYALQLVVYDPATGQSLGQPVIINQITVAPAQVTPPLAALSIPNLLKPAHPEPAAFNLIGYAQPDQIQPGQAMWLWLYWQASSTPVNRIAPPSPPLTGGIRLILSDGQTESTTDVPLADSVGPLDSWQPGQVRRAIYHLPTSPALTGPQAQVSVSLLNPTGQVETQTRLGPINLEVRPHQFEAPAIAHPLKVGLGQPIKLTLIGYDLPAKTPPPGELLPLTLYWRAEAEMDTAYTVFVQLLNSARQIAAQVDQPPLSGAAPTTTWLPGEIITDAYHLLLPPDLPAGEYRFIAGLYNPATGERLPTTLGSNFVELPPFTVK